MADLDKAWAALRPVREAAALAEALAAYAKTPTARRARLTRLRRALGWGLIAAGMALALNLIGDPHG